MQIKQVIIEVFLELPAFLEKPDGGIRVNNRPSILTNKVEETNSKMQNDWELDYEDRRPSNQHNTLNVENKGNGSLSQRSLNSDKKQEVDDDCAKEFLANTFNEASEKDLKTIKSERKI